MNNDLINSIFECIGGLLMWLNVIKLIKDKGVRGLYLSISLFFTLWSIWSVYYYPDLRQPFSGTGAIILASGNIVWISLAFWYKIIKYKV